MGWLFPNYGIFDYPFFTKIGILASIKWAKWQICLFQIGKNHSEEVFGRQKIIRIEIMNLQSLWNFEFSKFDRNGLNYY